MIVEAIFNIFITIASGILDLLPDIPAPDISGRVAEASGVFGFFAWANNFVPVDQIIVCIGLVVTFYVALHLVRFTVWLLIKAHVLGGA